MAIIVQKYGGSSVADVHKIGVVAQQIVQRARAGNSLVVVVSAMGKSTDALIRQAGEVCSAPPRREMDMLVTAGERISMALLTMAIHDLGEEAISFTGSQSGIITEDSHQGARILEVRPYRIEEELGRGKVVIVAGYQGVSLKREVTTLGRGGSDTTAVALAAALGAECCEIYSDVDGVYDADPNVCPQARLIPEIGYETMQTMASAGAKVLNAQAVEFARRAEIAIVARKTGDSRGRQTRVMAQGKKRPKEVTAVVGAASVSRITGAFERVQEMNQAIRRAGGCPFGLSGAGQTEIWVHRTDIPGKAAAPLVKIAEAFKAQHWDGAVVTVAGTDLLSEALGLARERLEQAGIDVAGMLASESSLSFGVESAHLDQAVQTLHASFLSTPSE